MVIDNPTTLPVWVRDAAQILKGNVDRYVFTSTISVYPDSKTGLDENAPLQKYEGADPYKETLESMKANGFKLYGPLKVLSEKEAAKWFPGKTLIIRPGLIVGPRDESDRFTYWPVRIDRGGEVLAPGKPQDSVQYIDGRDLAEWTIRMAENGETGIYNATGPARPIGIGGMLDGIKTALKSNAKFTWVNEKFLTDQKVQAWSDMPVWAGAEDGITRTNISRALSKGLTFRSLDETARDTLAWFKSLAARSTIALKAGHLHRSAKRKCLPRGRNRNDEILSLNDEFFGCVVRCHYRVVASSLMKKLLTKIVDAKARRNSRALAGVCLQLCRSWRLLRYQANPR